VATHWDPRFISKEIEEFLQCGMNTEHQREEDKVPMQMTIRYQNGARSEAVLLAASRERMRLATGSNADTIELQKLDAFWWTERGEQIEIEALIPMSGMDVSQFCAEVYPRAAAAGRSLVFD